MRCFILLLLVGIMSNGLLMADEEVDQLAAAAANSDFFSFDKKKGGKYGKDYDIDAKKIFSGSGQKFYCVLNKNLIFEVKITGVCYGGKGKKSHSTRRVESYNLSGPNWEHYLPVFREAPGLFSSGGESVTYTFEFKRIKPSNNKDIAISVFSGESVDGDEIDIIETDSTFTLAGQHNIRKVTVVSNQKIEFTSGHHGSWQVNTVLKGGKGIVKYTYKNGGNNMVCFMVPAVKFEENIELP